MKRRLKLTPRAQEQLAGLSSSPGHSGILKQVQKALAFLEIDPGHPGLNSHDFFSLSGRNGERVYESYAQNKTAGAYRIFWHYGPDEGTGKARVPVITIVAITSHP